MGTPLLFTEEFELVIMIAVAIEEMLDPCAERRSPFLLWQKRVWCANIPSVF